MGSDTQAKYLRLRKECRSSAAPPFLLSCNCILNSVDFIVYLFFQGLAFSQGDLVSVREVLALCLAHLADQVEKFSCVHLVCFLSVFYDFP